jgi:hypothetical protein
MATSSASGSTNHLARVSRAVGLWILTLTLPLGRQVILHFKLPDVVAAPPARVFDSPKDGILTVGVAITITGCFASFVDGAAVLRYSLLRHSTEKYRYQFYAIYHPDARPCVQGLSDVGYHLLERETPVNISAIEGEELRGRIAKSGMCGEARKVVFLSLLLSGRASDLIFV